MKTSKTSTKIEQRIFFIKVSITYTSLKKPKEAIPGLSNV